MKRLFAIILLFFVGVSFGLSQATQPPESQKLSQQISILYQQGNFGEAISLAEKALEIEQKSSNKNYERLAAITVNLGVLRKERVKRYLTLSKYYTYDAANNQISPVREAGTYQTASEDFQIAEKLFRNVLKLGKTKIKPESPQIATAMNELAWLIQNGSRMMLNSGENVFEETEKLYTQALVLREKLYGVENDATLITVLELADFYSEQAEFENASDLYERYISEAEKNHGKNNKNLIRPLQAYSRILVSTDRENEALTMIQKASQIAEQTLEMPSPNFNLSFRTNDWKIANREFSRIFLSQDSAGQVNAASASISTTAIRIVGSKSRITRISVKVVIDETGKVITAAADTADGKLKSSIEKEVLQWKFKPFVHRGKAEKMKGSVTYFHQESNLYQKRN